MHGISQSGKQNLVSRAWKPRWLEGRVFPSRTVRHPHKSFDAKSVVVNVDMFWLQEIWPPGSPDSDRDTLKRTCDRFRPILEIIIQENGERKWGISNKNYIRRNCSICPYFDVASHRSGVLTLFPANQIMFHFIGTFRTFVRVGLSSNDTLFSYFYSPNKSGRMIKYIFYYSFIIIIW